MSLSEITDTIMQFIKTHQTWSLPLVFFFAFGESLAVLSLLIPATAILLGIGALIGAGLLPFMPVLITASCGAILGDWISYWLGKHYHQQIITSRPLNRYPKMIFKAEQFFHRYGLLGVFIGRFFGPLRAFVPLVAGAMHMPSFTFMLANVTSAPAWAFVMLAPGAFGIKWLEALFA